MTAANTVPSTPTKSEELVARLDALVRRGERARLAALRRLLAPPARWGPDEYAAGIPLLPAGLWPSEMERWLLVAGLYALWHQGQGVPSTSRGANFGESMRVLAKETAHGVELSDAVERRFSVLLASEDERLAHYLRQSVGQLASAGVEVDFGRLLDDLRHWGHPERYVQRRWAVSFWAPRQDGAVHLTEQKEQP